MSIEQQIKHLKEQHNQANIRKGICEAKLKELEVERTKIKERCIQLGVDDKDLGTEIMKKEQKQQDIINELNNLLGNNQQVEDDSAPF